MEPGLQADLEEGGKDNVEVKMQFSLGTGLAIVEAQMQLGVAEGKLDWKAGTVEMEEAHQ